jgi:hypothetical protein
MTTPTTREALERVLKGGRRSLHTSFPAKVLAYDAASQTVDLEPQLMRELEDDDGALEFEQLPTLYDVPVQWPRAGGFVVTFPIATGDYVEVQCAEQSTLAWRASGAVSVPGISQAHGLNGCIAKPGWYPDTKKLTGVSTADLVIGKEDGSSTIKVKADGTVTLASDVGAQALALANLVRAELLALKTAIDSAVVSPAADGGASFKAGLITQLQDWPASVAATKVKAV